MAVDESANPTKYHQSRDTFGFLSSTSASHLGAYQIMVGEELFTFMPGNRSPKCPRMQNTPRGLRVASNAQLSGKSTKISAKRARHALCLCARPSPTHRCPALPRRD